MSAARSEIERVAATDFTVLLRRERRARNWWRANPRVESRRTGRSSPSPRAGGRPCSRRSCRHEERTATGVRGRRKFEAAEGGTPSRSRSVALRPGRGCGRRRSAVERVGGHAPTADIRIVAATNRGLNSVVEQRPFARSPYRLSGVDIRAGVERAPARHRSWHPFRAAQSYEAG